MPKKLTSEQSMSAILSYLGILWLIPLLVIKRRGSFVNFHLNQGINLFLLEVIVLIILEALGAIPILGLLFDILRALAWVFFIVVMIIAIVRGSQGEMWEIPIVKDIKFVKLK